MRIHALLACTAAFALSFPLGCGNGTPPAAKPSGAASSSASTPEPAPTASSTTSTTSTTSAPTDVVVGGPCSYAKQQGQCVIGAGGTFTFTGVVDGAKVSLPGNSLGTADKAPAVGASVPCTIDFITVGTCTPCMFSIGSCGQPAWEAFRKHK
jgi:hypothetical protein